MLIFGFLLFITLYLLLQLINSFTNTPYGRLTTATTVKRNFFFLSFHVDRQLLSETFALFRLKTLTSRIDKNVVGAGREQIFGLLIL